MNSIPFLNLELSKLMRVPGAIYRLPVPFNLAAPSRFLIRKDKTPIMGESQESMVTVGNVWRDEETRQYHYTHDKEVLIQAKVRPFLIVRRFNIKNIFREGGYYLGLPIGSVKEKLLSKPEVSRKLCSNQYDHLYYLSPEDYRFMGLEKPSMVVINCPTYLPAQLFTHYMGFIPRHEFLKIHNRLHTFVDNIL